MTDVQFEQIYWDSKNKDVRTLRAMPVGEERTARALDLASKGNVIDGPIMMWGWGAFNVMTLRVQFGYTWVPALLSPPVQLAPGLALPGFAPYDPKNPPVGSIKVSLDAADYPPFDPPAPVPVIRPKTSLVGFNEGAGYFQAFEEAAIHLKDGEEYGDDPRGIFIYHRVQSFLGKDGFYAWFQKK